MTLDLAALNASMEQRDAYKEAQFQKQCEYNALCHVAATEAEKRGYAGMEAEMFIHGFKRHSPKDVNPRKHGLEGVFKEGRALAVAPEIKRAIRVETVAERKASAAFAPAPVTVSFAASSNGE